MKLLFLALFRSGPAHPELLPFWQASPALSAFPAGVARMRLLPFTIYTLMGSYIWCLVLAYAGLKLGQHWKELAPYFHRFDTAIGLLLAIGIGLLLYNRIKGLSTAHHGE